MAAEERLRPRTLDLATDRDPSLWCIVVPYGNPRWEDYPGGDMGERPADEFERRLYTAIPIHKLPCQVHLQEPSRQWIIHPRSVMEHAQPALDLLTRVGKDPYSKASVSRSVPRRSYTLCRCRAQQAIGKPKRCPDELARLLWRFGFFALFPFSHVA